MAAITAQELELQMPDASKLLSDEPEMESSALYAVVITRNLLGVGLARV